MRQDLGPDGQLDSYAGQLQQKHAWHQTTAQQSGQHSELDDELHRLNVNRGVAEQKLRYNPDTRLCRQLYMQSALIWIFNSCLCNDRTHAMSLHIQQTWKRFTTQ